jgi:hypothetical protein
MANAVHDRGLVEETTLQELTSDATTKHDPDADPATRSPARAVAGWWVRRHPRQTVKAAAMVARHPRRSARVVSEARTVQEASQHPRVRGAAGQAKALLKDAAPRDAIDPEVWISLAQAANGIVTAYAGIRARRMRRRRRMARIAAAAGLIGAGALAATWAARRADRSSQI